jgi:hypothetical protein
VVLLFDLVTIGSNKQAAVNPSLKLEKQNSKNKLQNRFPFRICNMGWFGPTERTYPLKPYRRLGEVNPSQVTSYSKNPPNGGFYI